MKLIDVVCPDAVIAQLDSSERDNVIEQLVLSLAEHTKMSAAVAKTLAKAVIKRENEASTGIGKGVAVPHVKHKAITDPVAVVGCSQEGVDFASLDKQPVYSVFLLLSPASNPDKHLQAMETIFKNLQKEDFRRFLRQARTPEAILEAIKDADEDNH
ncbi:MAG: PTS sugar transporter subunit IIA [Planctomycetota bacterium]|jgi:mannitol/fructose-specific phosphotransferase system IIA component (Ntr-type)